MPRLPNEEITLTLRPETAQTSCAALKVFGTLTAGEPDDPDTDLTAEAFEAYLSTMRQVYGGDGGFQSTAGDDEITELAKQLETDMLAIVHRNYRRTAEGFVKQ